LKESTQPIHELEPDDLPARDHDHPWLVGLDKPQPEEPTEPDGPGYWATIHDQRVWVRLCPPGSAQATLTLRERFGSKRSAASHEQRTRLGGDVHHGGHEHPEGYEGAAADELEGEVRQTRGSWASGWSQNDA